MKPGLFLMPRVDEVLDKLGHVNYICSLHLTKGFWQIPLEASAKTIISVLFTTHAGLSEFTVLPFGLRNSPATFQREETY